MQVDLRYPPTKVFFFQTSTGFFPLLFKYHVVSQHQSDDYIDEDGFTDMVELIVL